MSKMAQTRAPRILLGLCILVVAGCSTSPERVVTLSDGWLYRWGDSPRNADGAFAWLREPSVDGWRAIPYPSNPPDRQGRRNVWYRVRMPETDGRDPALFIYSVDVNAELYLDGLLLYRWGALDESGQGRFRGWPWHLVELPPDAGGRELSVRIYSDYRDIGLWGPVLVGSRSDLLSRLYARDAPRLAVAAASFLLAAALLALYLLQKPREPLSLHLGLATLSLILRVFARTHIKQLCLDAPLLWDYLSHVSTFLIAIFVILVIQQIVGKPYHRVTRVVPIALLAMLAASLVLSVTGVLRIVDYLPFFDFVLVGIVALILVLTVLAATRGNQEARLLTASFAVIGALTVYSTLVSNNLVAWSDEIDYLIVFVFSLGVSALIVRRVLTMQKRIEEYATGMRAQSDRLKEANEELERKVAERTSELELANRRLVDETKVLQVVSITDSLTGMHNRMYVLDRLRSAVSHAHRYGETLSIAMFDLDHFKEVNDTWGHPAGDDVLRRVAEVFSTTLRESDLAGRYGGEEFLIVLPKADAQEAHLVAGRILARIEALRIRAGEHWLTASGGVAELAGHSDETLLQEADRNLYRAKEAGRNRIEPA